MTATETSDQIARFWKGYLSGTNRGSLVMQVKQQGNILLCKAIFEDQTFGPAMLSLEGKLVGTRAELRLINFCGLVLTAPLDGQLILNFVQDFRAAEGTWQTDIGTSGICKVHVAAISAARWSARLFKAKAKLLWGKFASLTYAIFLLAIVIFDFFKILEVSYWNLVLILIPAAYIFRTQLAELIELISTRVSKLGPVEFRQTPLTEDLRRVFAQQIQETVGFVALDGFLVLRTKLLLIWLNQGAVDRAQFNAYATAIGVPADNLDETWGAIITSGCATLAEGKLAISEFGRKYVAHLTQQR